MKKLIINQQYKIKVFHYRLTTYQDSVYIGKMQEKTLTQNEVHGFKGKTGIYLCAADDLNTRIL